MKNAQVNSWLLISMQFWLLGPSLAQGPIYYEAAGLKDFGFFIQSKNLYSPIWIFMDFMNLTNPILVKFWEKGQGEIYVLLWG